MLHTVQLIQVKQIEYHRNGICGEPFYVVKFIWINTGQDMLAVVFDDAMHTAVFDATKLRLGDSGFGSNSWRGDNFDAPLRNAIIDWKAKHP